MACYTDRNWQIQLLCGSAIDQVEHFFGPIVVMEQTGTPELKEFLLLGIVREQIRAKKHLSGDAHAYLDEIKKYIFNGVDGADDYLKLKVFSSKGDRLPTYRVAFGTDTNPKTPLLQTDIQMYVADKNGVNAFQKYALKKLKANFSDVPALWQLAQVLLNCLKIVWIPLDEQKDDAQAIFESLNDKGMPLTASELLCNSCSVPSWTQRRTPRSFTTISGLPAFGFWITTTDSRTTCATCFPSAKPRWSANTGRYTSTSRPRTAI